MDKRLSLFCVFLSLTACGSDFFQEDLPPEAQPQITEAGNPPANPLSKPSRLIIGTVPSESGGSCEADSVVAVDTAGQDKSASINPDCSFAISIQTGKAWGFYFLLPTGKAAFLSFQNGPDLSSPVYYVNEDDSSINLGAITYSGYRAIAQYDATRQTDRDADGISDYDDPDDDNDGIPDIDEADCDGDDILDDEDLELTGCVFPY